MKLIATATITGSPANIEFTSIPQTFTDLVLVINAKGSAAGTSISSLVCLVNGSDVASFRYLRGSGSAVTSGSSTFHEVGLMQRVAASGFGNTKVYFANYTSTSAKSVSSESVTENNATESWQQLTSLLYTGVTTGITTLILSDGSAGGGLAVGSTASLYGILKGSDGIVTTS